MADNGWSQSWAQRGLSATGIAEALEGYASLGGRLLGARRWAENPLTLTHVRWMGPRGEVVDAVRPPGGDQGVGAEERDVWVALALGFPAAHPSPAGRDAPWLPLDVSPQQAVGLFARLAHAYSAPQPGYGSSYGGGGYGSNYGSHPQPTSRFPLSPGAPPGSSLGGFHSGGLTTSPPPFASPAHSPPRYSDVGDYGAYDSGAGYGNGQGPEGGLRATAFLDEGVSVIPCVEIELPTAMMGPAAADAPRAFARDAAATFIRALQSVRQLREMRGWMRSGRLVLAARLIVAPGSGAPTQEERESAVRLLAQLLAQRTLPYARLGEADPGEWAQGQPLTA
jgi:hypothetical protein